MLIIKFAVFHRSVSFAKPEKMMIAPATLDSLNDITRISTLQSGVIKHMDVVVGQMVEKGQPLFSLENDLIKNNVNIQKIILDQAKNQLLIQQEKIDHDQAQLRRLQHLDPRAISQSALQDQIYKVNLNKVQFTQAKRQVSLAAANLKQAEMTLQQYQVVSPKKGIVLQVNAHDDEFVGSSQPMIWLGDSDKVMVRVSLDERDIQRFSPNGKAYLTSHANHQFNIPLTFLRLNQYVVTQEHVNFSRVQEAIYYFSRKNYSQVVAGQQLDANIPVKKNG